MLLDSLFEGVSPGFCRSVWRRKNPEKRHIVARTETGFVRVLGPETGNERTPLPREWVAVVDDWEADGPVQPTPAEGLVTQTEIKARGWTIGLIKGLLGPAPAKASGKMAWPLSIVLAAEANPTFSSESHVALTRATRRTSKAEATILSEVEMISWPTAPGISVHLEAGEMVLKSPYDETLVRALNSCRGSSWDRSNRVWRIPFSARRQVVQTVLPLLTDLAERLNRAARQHTDDYQQTLQAVRALNWPKWFHVTVVGAAVTFIPPDIEGLAERLRSIGAIDPYSGPWRVSAEKLPQLHQVLADIGAAMAADYAGRRQSADLSRTAQVAKPRILMPRSTAWSIGSTHRLGEQVVVVESYGKPFRITDEHPSTHGSQLLGYEGDLGHYVYYRLASSEEVVRFEAEVAAVRQIKETRRRVSERFDQIADRIRMTGTCPPAPVSIPKDRVERPDRPWTLYGTGEVFAHDSDHLYFVRNNGNDGDNWAHNNVITGGAGAIGWAIPFDPEMWQELCSLARQWQNGHDGPNNGATT